MKELFRSNDLVLISWADALLRAEGIAAVVLDIHMSVLEGSANAIPRRVMVENADFAAARALIEAARREIDLAADIRWPDDQGRRS